MADSNFFAYVTFVGLDKIESAYNNSEKVNLVEMAIGDSGGVYVEPDPQFTSLVNEFGRVPIHESSVQGTLIHIISYIQSTVETQGKTLREYGIYDDEGDLIIYGSYADSLIPSVENAEYLQLEIESITDLVNADSVTVTVNPITPHATETEAGISRRASSDDVASGTDDTAHLTISKMLGRKADVSGQTGVTALSSSLSSESEELAATPKAVYDVHAKVEQAQLDIVYLEDAVDNKWTYENATTTVYGGVVLSTGVDDSRPQSVITTETAQELNSGINDLQTDLSLLELDVNRKVSFRQLIFAPMYITIVQQGRTYRGTISTTLRADTSDYISNRFRTGVFRVDIISSGTNNFEHGACAENIRETQNADGSRVLSFDLYTWSESASSNLWSNYVVYELQAQLRVIGTLKVATSPYAFLYLSVWEVCSKEA